jgi:hypothetical protein
MAGTKEKRMKPEQIEIGGRYECRIGDEVKAVRVVETHPKRGWLVTPLDEGEPNERQIHVELSAQFRERLSEEGTTPTRPTGRFGAKAAKADGQVVEAPADESPAPAAKPPKAKAKKETSIDHSDKTPEQQAEQEAAVEAAMTKHQNLDPDKCFKPRCRGTVVGTYLGKPYCEEHNPLADSNKEKHVATPVKAKKGSKSAKTATKKAPSRTKKAPSSKAEKNPSKTPNAPRKGRDGQMSMVEAAIVILKKAGKPLGTKEMVEKMGAQGLWKSPRGKTPHATLYARLLTEIQDKGKESRFDRPERGKFCLRD